MHPGTISILMEVYLPLLENEANRLNRQCYLVGSSKTAPRIWIFSIAQGADYSLVLNSIDGQAP